MTEKFVPNLRLGLGAAALFLAIGLAACNEEGGGSSDQTGAAPADQTAPDSGGGAQ